MGKLGKAILPDLALIRAAGIEPHTGLPARLITKTQRDPMLKENSRRLFRIMDEARAVNRYKWYNVPAKLSSQEIERLLYYKYTLCFFYYEDMKEFFFMPYALDGGLDFYQRYNVIHPVPMCANDTKNLSNSEKSQYKAQEKILSQLKLNVVKDIVVYKDEITRDLLTKSAVILRDYTNQLSQLGEPRYSLNDHLLDLEADCIPFIRTNLLLGTGVQGMRVEDADAASEVDAVAQCMYTSALVGNPYIAITSKAEFQELQPNSTMKASEFFLSLQSIDNLLLSSYGIENTGVYEKKAHILESENAVNANNISLILQDGLSQRQNFCNIVNSIWGTNMWCEISEDLLGYDANGDMVPYDENTNGAGSGASPTKDKEGGEE